MLLRYESGKIITKSAKSAKAVVDGVSFSIDEGKTLAIVGETGAGKTMIASSIMNLLPRNLSCDGLSVEFLGNKYENGKRLDRFLGKEIVYIPQSGRDNLNPIRKIGAQIADGLYKLGVKRSDIPSAVADRLNLVGLDERLSDEYPSVLSGGMAGKVVLAMSASPYARLVLADEPTAGMDAKSKFECLNLIKSLFPESAILLITHDLEVAETADDVLVLCDGKALEYGNAEKVLHSPSHPYTRALVSSFSGDDNSYPRIRYDGSDCPFYGRCAEASNLCKSVIPTRVENGVSVRCAK